MAEPEKCQLFDVAGDVVARGGAFVGGFRVRGLLVLFVCLAEMERGQVSAFAAQRGFGLGQFVNRLFVFRSFYRCQSGPKMDQTLVLPIIRPDQPRPAPDASHAQQAADDDDGARMLTQDGPLFPKPADQTR